MKNKTLKKLTERNRNFPVAKKGSEQFPGFSKKDILKCIACCFIFTIISIFSATAQEWKKGKEDNILYAVPQQYNGDTTQLGVKVGIGTANPQKTLDVVGDARIKGSLTVDTLRVSGELHVGRNSLTFGTYDKRDTSLTSNGSDTIDFIRADAEELFIQGSNGGMSHIKVGIGTIYPQAQLHLGIDDEAQHEVFMLFSKGVDSAKTNTTGLQIGIDTNSRAIISQRQNLPMLFKTNSTERMRILSNGNIGIGDTTGSSKLTINSDSSGISGLQFTQLNLASTSGNANGKVLSLDSTGKVILVNDSGSGNVTACSSWASTYNNYVPKWSSSTSRELCKSIIYDNGSRVGIGTSTLNSSFKLNVQGSVLATGTAGEGDKWFEANSTSSSGAFSSVLRFMAVTSGSYGHPQSQLQYNGLFRILGDGNVRMVIDSTGNMCVGSTSPTAKLDVQGTSNFNGNMTITGNVTLNGSGTYTGTWTDVSDQMFKTNVNSIYSALNTIKQLNPKSFYFDTANVYGLNFSDKKQYGFIAQDIETLLPELVFSMTKNADVDAQGNIIHPSVTYKTLNYNAFLGILTKGIQEQSTEIDSLKNVLNNVLTKTSKQDSVNNSLQNQLNQLLNCCKNNEGRSSEHSNTSGQNYKTENSSMANQTDVELNDIQTIVLEQNVPNPFAEQTTISYFLPDNTAKAQMLFYNAQGKLIQSVELVQKGKGQLNVFANDLSSGIYTYTLVVDGKIIETKKMVKE